MRYRHRLDSIADSWSDCNMRSIDSGELTGTVSGMDNLLEISDLLELLELTDDAVNTASIRRLACEALESIPVRSSPDRVCATAVLIRDAIQCELHIRH